MQSLLVIVLIAAVFANLILLCLAVLRHDRTRSVYFGSLISALFIYSLGYLLELTSATGEAAITAFKLESLGIPMLAPCSLLCALGLFYPGRVKTWMLAVVFVYGMFFFLCILSNDYHNLNYVSYEMVDYNGFRFLRIDHGPMYFVQQVIGFSAVAISMVLLIRAFMSGNWKLRRHMINIILGAAIAFSGNVINVLRISSAGIDFLPITMTIGLIFIAVDIFHHNVMDIVHISSAMALETMDDSLIATDKSGGFMFCNASAKALFPGIGELRSYDSIFHLPNWPESLSDFSDGQLVNFKQTDPKSGDERLFRASVTSIISPRGKPMGWSIAIQDITDITILMDKLEQLAITDPLTGIMNRRYFLYEAKRKLSESVRSNCSVEWTMFDIDRFKNINDTYGHAAGDHVLIEVVDLVKNQLRPYDVFARYGGEEFIICTLCKESCDSALANRLRDRIENFDIFYGGNKITVTASFGVAITAPGTTIEKALSLVDSAMYMAKSQGRNRVYLMEHSHT